MRRGRKLVSSRGAARLAEERGSHVLKLGTLVGALAPTATIASGSALS